MVLGWTGCWTAASKARWIAAAVAISLAAARVKNGWRPPVSFLLTKSNVPDN
jgi:hypothetical protein